MPNFTPGPWSYYKEMSNGCYNITSPKGAVVAETNWSYKALVPDLTAKHQAANARLIAASPEMYAMLKDGSKFTLADREALLARIENNLE